VRTRTNDNRHLDHPSGIVFFSDLFLRNSLRNFPPLLISMLFLGAIEMMPCFVQRGNARLRYEVRSIGIVVWSKILRSTNDIYAPLRGEWHRLNRVASGVGIDVVTAVVVCNALFERMLALEAGDVDALAMRFCLCSAGVFLLFFHVYGNDRESVGCLAERLRAVKRIVDRRWRALEGKSGCVWRGESKRAPATTGVDIAEAV
jgi:hypothetical protein